MRLATWNVNSVKQRVPRLLPWLDERRPDVVCLQETKLTNNAFADLLAEPLRERGYDFASNGQSQWNGVALLSRVGLGEVEHGFAGMPGFPDAEARAISATCAGLRVHSLYVPNGRVPDSDHYRYKLEWLAALRTAVADGPARVALCGDMNIAPSDADVFDPAAYAGHTHVTAPERTALAALTISACATSSVTAGPTSGCSATGTTGRACSTRTWACASTWCWPTPAPRGSRPPGSTGRPARAPAPAITPR